MANFDKLTSGRNRSLLLDYLLLAIFASSTLAMLFQSYALIFSLREYVGIVILFIVSITLSILLRKQLIALIGIFLFSITTRLMYFVATGFSVLASGDPYGQYTVLEAFSQSSHVTLVHSPNFLNFLTRTARQYSEWPGFQAFSLGLSRVTGLPLFWTAQVVPFILFGIWFVISYAIIRNVFARFAGDSAIVSVLSMAVASALPTFEQPIFYKYDFMGALFLLGIILLLTHSMVKNIKEKSLIFIILIPAIVVTHNLTALFLIMLLTLVGVYAVIRALPTLPRFTRIAGTKKIGRSSLPRLALFSVACVAVWWTYYATFVKTYASNTIGFLLRSLSLRFLSLSRVGGQRGATLSLLTPSWLLSVLRYRDDLLLGLFGIGLLILVVRPSILGKWSVIAPIVLSVGIVTIITEAFQALNFGDRAFLTFAPILACFLVMPVAAMVYLDARVGKAGGILLMCFFLFSIGLGFWGSSYAPVFLYSNTSSAYAFGEHPTNWQQVANYVNYVAPSGNNSTLRCVLTNEIYVTSLVVPLSELGFTYPYPDIRAQPGCIAIIYNTLTHFNDSYISEPLSPYTNTSSLPAFSDSAFSNTLSNESDLVFNGGNITVYYVH
jgi:hypothetical protein